MPKLTHDQLQEWYAQLKTTLFDQVDIDLNSKEDLGSLHIIRINEWNFASPDSMPPVDDIYPLIPHRPLNPGEPSNDPLLTHYCYDPPAPDKSNMEEYLEWMWNNISTEPSDDQIQELYDMYLLLREQDDNPIPVVSGNAMRRNPVLRNICGKFFNTKPGMTLHTEEAAFGAALYGAVSAGILTRQESRSRIQYL